MIRVGRRLVVTAVLLGLADPASPATLRDASFHGSRRGAFLGHGVGARAVGMGEAFTALADDPTAGFWNPGGLARLKTVEVTAMYDAAGAGVGLSYLAAALPLGPGVAGASLTLLSFGDTIRRDAAGVRLGTEGLTDFAFAGSYAIRHPRGFGIPGATGATLEIVGESAAGPGVGVTLGSAVPVASNVILGWVVQHLSAPTSGFALPAVLKAGAGWVPMETLSLAADLGYGFAGQGMVAALGAEIRPRAGLAVRAGYRRRGSELGLSGTTGMTVGAGVNLRTMGLDYAYQPFGDLATSHRIALHWKPGKPGRVSGPAAPPGSGRLPAAR